MSQAAYVRARRTDLVAECAQHATCSMFVYVLYTFRVIYQALVS